MYQNDVRPATNRLLCCRSHSKVSMGETFCVKCLVRLNRQPAISPWQYLPDLSVSQIVARTSWNCDMVLTCLLLLSCRGHTYKFEEFLMVWTDELKNREPTTMTVRLQKEVDKYKVRIQ